MIEERQRLAPSRCCSAERLEQVFSGIRFLARYHRGALPSRVGYILSAITTNPVQFDEDL
jgi:hypothetical protein